MSSQSIHKIMSNALKADWAVTDDFDVYIYNKHLQIDGIQGYTSQDILNMCVTNVDIPALTSDVNNKLVSGAWRLHTSKFQPFTTTVTFRDLNGLRLRERFTEIWMAQQRQYFDDIKTEIKITLGEKVFSSDNMLITSISQSQLDNSNNQVVEFTVEFTSSTYSNASVTDYGKFGAWSQE